MIKYLIFLFLGSCSDDTNCDGQETNSNRLRISCLSKGPSSSSCLGSPSGEKAAEESCLMGARIQCSPFDVIPYQIKDNVDDNVLVILDQRNDRRIVFDEVVDLVNGVSRSFLIARYEDDPTGSSTLDLPSCD